MAVNRILDHHGRPLAPRNGSAAARHGVAVARPRRPVEARYDSAEVSRETRNHWAQADSLSARAANSIQVRHRLRTRSRYEVANNSYAKGIVETLANDTIGVGPRLQLLTPDATANRAIEAAFMCWCDCIGLPEKLRTMRKARAEDGEAFALLTTNPGLDSPVQLDVKLLEADQVATPTFFPSDPLADDGIRYDRHGNPTEYHVLKSHPGDLVNLAPFGDFDRVPAALMVHWFRADRPGQSRGVPEITPALPLFAQLRRYTLAVIAAAETAADLAAVLESELPPGDDLETPGQDYMELDIPRRTMVTIPAGWKMGQFKSEQPTTTYPQFKAEILNEIARCLNMPYNVAAGNSSGYNYSSGRLDHQVYYKSLKVDKAQAARVILDRLLSAWLAEAALATDLIPRAVTEWPRRWLWGGTEHVDPEKEANAQGTLLANGMTSFSEECQKQGVDPDARAETIAADNARFKRLGISVPWNAPPPASPPAGAPGKPPGKPAPDPEPPPADDGGADDETDDY